MLLTGREKTEITIETPKGIPYTAQILRICRKEREVSCAVEKDGGDDPDITTGALICAKVSLPQEEGREALARVVIDGGFGVGRVTKPGLDQPVGNAAINHVPREMIEREVLQVCQVLDYCGRRANIWQSGHLIRDLASWAAFRSLVPAVSWNP